MKRKKRWIDTIPWANIRYSLPTMAIALLAMGYLIAAMMILLPQWQSVNSLIAEINQDRDELLSIRRNALELPGKLDDEISAAKAQLDTLRQSLMDRDTAAALLDQLYVISLGNDAQIVDLQSQPSPEVNKEAMYDISSFKVNVQGNVKDILAFLRQVEAISAGTATQIGEFEIASTDETDLSLLSFTMTLYTRTDQTEMTPLVSNVSEDTEQDTEDTELLEKPEDWPSDWSWPPSSPLLDDQTETTSIAIPQSYISHTIAEGETLLGIALQYGVSAEVISQLNGLDVRAFVIGDTLQIPVYAQ